MSNNNIYFPTYQYNVPAYLQSNEDDLDEHFHHLLGQSQSRYTAAQSLTSSPEGNQQTFHSTRMFVIGTLESYGMTIGTLPYSKDNQITLKCILDLISQKQKDTSYKTKIKQQLNAVNFQKEKYESLLKQSKNTITEKQRLLGKIENECTQLKKKIKLLQTTAKKEKNDDQKMIMMLKSKNDLLLHQIKKKQAQILRVKEQMKRSVVNKTANKNQSPTHNSNYVVKNSFQIIEKIQRKGEKWKKNALSTQRTTRTFVENAEEQKFNFMMEKYEKEKKIFFNQNSLLRAKVYEIREILVNFAEWVEIQLFGQSTQSATRYLQKRFICNHNMMLSKNALIDDLIEIIDGAKGGIVELQERLIQSEATGAIRSKSISTPGKYPKIGYVNNPSSKTLGQEPEHHFKKKSSSIRQTVTFNVNSSPINSKTQKTIKNSYKQTTKIQKQKPKQKVIPQRSRQTQPPTYKIPQMFRATYENGEDDFQPMSSQIRGATTKQTYFNELQLSAFDNDVLSDIYENSVREDPDHSIVSHISTNELLKEIQKGKSGKYDKWDILFKSSGDEGEDQ